MPHKTKELRKEYRQKNRERILERQREWYHNHPEKQKEYESHRNKEQRDVWQKEYRTKHKEHLAECFKLSAFKRYWRARQAVVQALGGKCIKCGFSDIKALHVHHKDGGGTKERKLYGAGMSLTNYRYYQGLLKHLNDLELLCANCHSILNWNESHPDAPEIKFEDILIFKTTIPIRDIGGVL